MTNSGWPPGTITINTRDYSRYWQTVDPSALEVSLRPESARSPAGERSRPRLGLGRGCRFARAANATGSPRPARRQGLETLAEISTLLLIAAGLAVASALSAAVWQRRSRLASLKIQGYDSSQLWRALLLESTITVGVGCAIGGVVGVYGHALAGRWLTLTTGFPAPFSIAPTQVLVTLMLITARWR